MQRIRLVPLRRFPSLPLSILALALLLLSTSLAAQTSEDIVRVSYDPSALSFDPIIAHDGMTLTVTDSRKFMHVQQFADDEGGTLEIRGFADGVYDWEVHARPDLAPELAQQIAEDRAENDMTLVCDLQDKGILPLVPLMQSGTFTIIGGSIVDPNRPEEGSEETQATAEASRQPGATVDGLTNATDEFYTNSNLYVHNSACIGFDCPSSGLSFGSDTIRLKEHRLRIHFEDTSVGSFPSTDWRIIANDASAGGANRFRIQDATASRIPFSVEANARNHALYVDNGGRVGLGTSNPVVEMHMVSGDTPTLRLNQDSSAGFGSQTWDVAGNESSFFIRDSTNGSQLPFRIRPGADSNSIYIENDNDIAFGTSSIDPDVRFQVQANTSANFAGLRVENTGTGNIQTHFAGNSWEWRQTFRSGDMIFDSQEDGANEWELDTDGNVTATSFNPTSDRNLKQGFEPVDGGQILERLAAIPVTQWSYRGDAAGTQHIGPVAQDFYAAFGVGADDRHISTTDADGVAFAAIQALYQRLLEKEQTLEQVQRQNRELAARLEALEASAP
ncbi:MAG: tail fiber domain-containing protein [Acidobacteriota bacterium]|nr:tail fiber domain-containing protein [Acidobacteriota bacterium]